MTASSRKNGGCAQSAFGGALSLGSAFVPLKVGHFSDFVSNELDFIGALNSTGSWTG